MSSLPAPVTIRRRGPPSAAETAIDRWLEVYPVADGPPLDAAGAYTVAPVGLWFYRLPRESPTGDALTIPPFHWWEPHPLEQLPHTVEAIAASAALWLATPPSPVKVGVHAAHGWIRFWIAPADGTPDSVRWRPCVPPEIPELSPAEYTLAVKRGRVKLGRVVWVPLLPSRAQRYSLIPSSESF